MTTPTGAGSKQGTGSILEVIQCGYVPIRTRSCRRRLLLDYATPHHLTDADIDAAMAVSVEVLAPTVAHPASYQTRVG